MASRQEHSSAVNGQTDGFSKGLCNNLHTPVETEDEDGSDVLVGHFVYADGLISRPSTARNPQGRGSLGSGLNLISLDQPKARVYVESSMSSKALRTYRDWLKSSMSV